MEGCLGVWVFCHSYLDRPIPDIFVLSPNGLLLFDLAATLVENKHLLQCHRCSRDIAVTQVT